MIFIRIKEPNSFVHVDTSSDGLIVVSEIFSIWIELGSLGNLIYDLAL